MGRAHTLLSLGAAAAQGPDHGVAQKRRREEVCLRQGQLRQSDDERGQGRGTVHEIRHASERHDPRAISSCQFGYGRYDAPERVEKPRGVQAGDGVHGDLARNNHREMQHLEHWMVEETYFMVVENRPRGSRDCTNRTRIRSQVRGLLRFVPTPRRRVAVLVARIKTALKTSDRFFNNLILTMSLKIRRSATPSRLNERTCE